MVDDRADVVLLSAAALAAAAFFVTHGLGYAEDATLRLLPKPIPVLALAAWVWRHRADGAGGANRANTAIAAGLVVSAVADVAIEFAFIAGLGTFLAAHLLYAWAFHRRAEAWRPRWVPVFVLWGGAFLWVAGPQLQQQGMLVPVILYLAAIMFMMWRAAAGASVLALLGALAFGLSDTLIGLNKFWMAIPAAEWWIMSLYWAGQFGIAASVAGRGD